MKKNNLKIKFNDFALSAFIVCGAFCYYFILFVALKLSLFWRTILKIKLHFNFIIIFSILSYSFLACKKEPVTLEKKINLLSENYFCRFTLDGTKYEFNDNYFLRTSSTLNNLTQFNSCSIFKFFSLSIIKTDSTSFFCDDNGLTDIKYCNFENFHSLFSPGTVPFYCLSDHECSGIAAFNTTLKRKAKFIYIDTSITPSVFFPNSESSGKFEITEAYKYQISGLGVVILAKGTFSCILINRNNVCKVITDGEFFLPFLY